MPILTLKNKAFNYPDPGQQPGAGDSSIGYGEDATAWAEEVTAILNSLLAIGDIIRSQSSINNNISVAEEVLDMAFDNTLTRAANVMYTIERPTSSAVSPITETGTLYLNFNADSGSWDLSQIKFGDAGVAFSVSSEGLVKYVSTDTGVTTPGVIVFSAKTLSQ
jgi:hypothetical protein